MRLLITTCVFLFPALLISQEVLWSKNYGGSQYEELVSIKKLDSTYIAMGHTSSVDFDLKNRASSIDNNDGWILKLDEDGEVIWSRSYGGSDHDRIKEMIEVEDGLIFLGETYSSDIPNINLIGNSDIWIIKTDYEGSVIWSKNYGSIGSDLPLDIFLTEDNTIIVSSTSNYKNNDVPNNLGGFDLWLFELDLEGNINWSKVYGGSRDDPQNSGAGTYSNDIGKIHYFPNQGYIITGNSESSDGDLQRNAGRTDNWILCINKDGELKWSYSFGSEKLDASIKVFPKNNDLMLFSNTNISSTGVAAYNMNNDEFLFINEIGKSNDFFRIIDGKINLHNNLVFMGYTTSKDYDLHSSMGVGLDGWLTELKFNTDLVWSKNYGGSSQDGFHGFEVVDTTEILAVGHSFSNDFDLPDNYGNADGWIIKIKDTCVTKKHEIDTFLCSNSYLLFQSDTIDQEGTYTDTFTAKTGCDSIIIWNVEVYGEVVDSIINATFCKSYTLPTGRVINQSGVYYDTLTSYLGCDSIIQYNLEKEFFLRDSFTIESCEIYLHQNGQVLESDGVINDTIYNTIICDSIFTYTIDIIDLDTISIALKKEEGQAIQYRDTAFTIPGQYIYRQEVATGCDNIYLIDVIDYKDCELYIPNAFTPNGDDINDWFAVSADASCELFNFRALIFDRWGQTIAESRNPLFIWDGDGYPSGVYVYFITYEYEGINGIQSEEEYGTISIVR